MKSRKAHLYSRVHKRPQLRFEDQRLTSYAGLLVIQELFGKLRLKAGLRRCFAHLPGRRVFGPHVIMLLLVVHLLLGYRRLRDLAYYRDDPMVLRLLGLRHLPDVSTVSRQLADADACSIQQVRAYCRTLVLDRLRWLRLVRLTLDFDGSVVRTSRWAEGTAVGFNKQKKGQRSYYHLFCTIAQTGQVFDVLPRAGNVHDSHGAVEFMLACIRQIRAACPGVVLEIRMDSAFFSDAMVTALDAAGIEFTISVPFERFAELKGLIESRRRWRRFNAELAYFDAPWKPKSWATRFRFLFIRRTVPRQAKGPLQLDLFIPRVWGHEFTVIVTNKATTMKKVLAFHHGRGAQENLFSELKSQCQMDYVAVRRLNGNLLYLMAAILTHNLLRELHMQAHERTRRTTEKRAALWEFTEAHTLRRTLLHRAGRFTSPAGNLTLTMSANPAVRQTLLHYLDRLKQAA